MTPKPPVATISTGAAGAAVATTMGKVMGTAVAAGIMNTAMKDIHAAAESNSLISKTVKLRLKPIGTHCAYGT